MNTPTHSSEHPKAITLLPAVTSLFVISLFALQALVTPISSEHAAQDIHHLSAESMQSQPKTSLEHSDQQASAPAGELPLLGQLQPFALTERSKQPFDQSQLQGKVWIADFIFTSCVDECPLMSAEMQKLQSAFADQADLRLVSFTVDPQTDTPERLQEYAAKYKAGASWHFLTGSKEDLYKVAIEGFKLPAQDLQQEQAAAHQHQDAKAPAHQHADTSGSSPFLHSQKFVLVDQQLRIRGYYDSTDAAALESLQKDLARLLPPH